MRAPGAFLTGLGAAVGPASPMLMLLRLHFPRPLLVPGLSESHTNPATSRPSPFGRYDVNRRDEVIPSRSILSMAWRADRRRDHTPIHILPARQLSLPAFTRAWACFRIEYRSRRDDRNRLRGSGERHVKIVTAELLRRNDDGVIELQPLHQ